MTTGGGYGEKYRRMVSLERGRRGERDAIERRVCVTYCPLSKNAFARESRADRELLAATGAIRNEFSARATDTRSPRFPR